MGLLNIGIEKQTPTSKRNKIAGVEVPPEWEECKSYGDIPFELASVVNPKKYGFDSKGNYLHWDDFICRFSEFKDVRVWAWYSLRFNRNLEDHANLCVKPWLPFQYSQAGIAGKQNKVERLSSLKHLKLSDTEKNNYLAGNLIMEEAISSAQLEGASTTRPVAKEMLESGRDPRDFSEKMILNNWRLLRFAIECTDEPLTIELIQQFNRIATEEVCENDHAPGQLRDGPINVEDKMTHEVIHEAPSHMEMNKLLGSLCKYANTEHEDAEFIHPIVKAIVIHFMIGYIHPFLDGNGRTARALFYWYAMKSGYTNFQYISISALLKTKAKKYARAYVCTETDQLDLTHFIDFHLSIIITSLEKFGSYLENKISEMNKAIEELNTSPFYPQLQLQHLTVLKKGLKEPGRSFTVKEIQSDFNVSSTAARGYLDKLADLELLVKYRVKGRLNAYIAPSNLREKLKLGE